MNTKFSPFLLRRAALAVALCVLCSGCRTGEPFILTRETADLCHTQYADCCGGCLMSSGIPLALDVASLPIDLAIQALGPDRIRVVDEHGEPVKGAEATVRADCGAPEDVILHRRTGRKGTFRIRRLLSKNGSFGAHIISARIAKDGYLPVRMTDFSAFDRTNIVTVTMGPLTNTPGRVRVFEWSRKDPAGRFPPWPTEPRPQEGLRATGVVGIDCIRGAIHLWDNKHRDYDLNLRVESFLKPTGGVEKCEVDLFVSGNADGIAIADIGPEGPDYVPEGTRFADMLPYLSARDFSSGKVLFFRLRGRSPDEPPRYGRVEIFWRWGLPAGIRRIVVSDTPGDRNLRFTAPPPVPVTP